MLERARGLEIAIVIAENVSAVPLAALAVLPALAILAMFRARAAEPAAQLAGAEQRLPRKCFSWTMWSSADDGYTGNHCRSVVKLADEVAEELKLRAE